MSDREQITVTGKPIEWVAAKTKAAIPDLMGDNGFYISYEPDDDPANPYQASCGEDDQESFATVDEAKAWCQDQLNRWIAQYAVVQAAQATPVEPDFQSRVGDWMLVCFGAEIAADTTERNHRFLEESLELVQSLGCTASEAHQLVDYVFSRPVGEPHQELGGVMVALAALARAAELSMNDAAEVELKRIWTKVEQILAKQAEKPKHSPLPTTPPASVGPDMVSVLDLVQAERKRQDEKWGGAAHDDEHSTVDFLCYIHDYTIHATNGVKSHMTDETRKRLIQVAALAVAAVESIDRKDKRSAK